MTPLGLHHLMATSHHYGAGLGVSELARPGVEPPSTTTVQTKAASALTVRRVAATPWRSTHPPWPHAGARRDDRTRIAAVVPSPAVGLPELPSGQTLWPGLCRPVRPGRASGSAMRARWDRLKGVIDAERFADVAARLRPRSVRRNGGAMPAWLLPVRQWLAAACGRAARH